MIDFGRKTTYFAQRKSDKAWKIGFSKNPHGRALSIGPCGTIVMRLILPFEKFPEKAMHMLFADLRIKGEWFRDDPRILYFIKCYGKESLKGREAHTTDIRLTLNKKDEELARAISKAQGCSGRAAVWGVFVRHSHLYSRKRLAGFSTTKAGRPKKGTKP
jgi:hypothetical protein